MTIPELARNAARAAARLRADLGVGPAEGVCPFDVAERVGVSVRLVALSSLEGMYSADPRPTIVVSVERPTGRQRYTCGHELGHHVFGHGTRIDEMADHVTESWTPAEFAAQRFAAALMMPKLAVDSAFSRRGWSAAQPTPETVFVIAQEFGVGFMTLVGHLERTIGHLPSAAADALRRTRLPQIRDRLAGFKVEHDLIVVDKHWARRTIDVEVGDVVVLPQHAQFEGACASLVEGRARHLVGVAPGIGSVLTEARCPPVSLRVSRRAFTGLARYRHLEDVVDDE